LSIDQDPPDAFRVEPVDGFVEDHGTRVAEQRRRDAQPLAHAQRETTGTPPCHLAQPDGVDDLVHA
jgi:hypothetical protein